ncbi:MAG: hypothetical protein OXG85_00695 [Chloroflexi bacterium]|nr:hypothetical protein [Chloroflexota bacterium]
MRGHCVGALRKHFPVILIVPLVIIALTWPTFARLFDGDEIWLHTGQQDKWQPLWDVWHIKRVLAGEAELFYTDYMFHPPGTSLAFYHINYLHALLALALQQVMPADNADNLLYLLAHCFNAFGAYVFIHHLIKDKWIALFGAVLVGISVPNTDGSTLPSMYVIGTLPLTFYFIHRAVTEGRRLFALLAGVCAGATTLISMNVFAFLLLTAAMYVFFLALPRLRQIAFWRQVILFICVCASISAFRIYPMVADGALRNEGLARHEGIDYSFDLLDFFVRSENPFFGDILRAALDVSPYAQPKRAYLGYINLIFVGCALLHAISHKPQRKLLIPWLAILVFCAIYRLGHFPTINAVQYTSVVLPARVLSDWFPFLFGTIKPWYFQIGLVTPLAVLACYGLAALLRSAPAAARAIVALVSALILAAEFYVPLAGKTLEREKLAYIDWLKSESSDASKLINLPLRFAKAQHLFYFQTLTDMPGAFGFVNRTSKAARQYIRDNLLLRELGGGRSVHCLPYNEGEFIAALEQLEEDGFTHIVYHVWMYGDQFFANSFWKMPEAYDDGFVKVYRVSDMRLSCETPPTDIPHIYRFLQSPWAVPGHRTAIVSVHQSDSLDAELVDYLQSLFYDWDGFLHLQLDNHELATGSASDPTMNLDQILKDSQIVYLIHNALEGSPSALIGHLALNGFKLCQRQRHEDGSVMARYVNRDYDCQLFELRNAFPVEYESGLRLENLIIDFSHTSIDFEFYWSNLPQERQSISLQVLNASGTKVLGQDATISLASLARQSLDITGLEPGDYVLNLIVYNFPTGGDVPGVRSDDSPFERMLEIATFEKSLVSRLDKAAVINIAHARSPSVALPGQP